MGDVCRTIQGTKVLICDAQGRMLGGEADCGDFLNTAWTEGAALIAVPVARLHADFFSLKSKVAGEIIQKFVNYRIRLAIVGDISRWQKDSEAFRDFVREANRGLALWFVADLDELELRLATRH